MTTLTPPTETPSAPPPAPRGSASALSIVAIVLGAVLIVGTVVGSALAAVRLASVRTETVSVDASGMTGLSVDISSATLAIEYDDIEEATLTVTSGGGASGWRLERDDDEVSVATDRGWWRGGWWSPFDGPDEAVLALPMRFSDTALDATLSLGAGAITADGMFGELSVKVSAGSVTVAGSADSLDADVSAGRLSVDLDEVRTAQVELSAGSIEGRLTGSSLDDLTARVSAGRLDLRIPRGHYNLTSDVSAGSFDHSLRTDTSSPHRVSVTVSAGSVTLRELR